MIFLQISTWWPSLPLTNLCQNVAFSVRLILATLFNIYKYQHSPLTVLYSSFFHYVWLLYSIPYKFLYFFICLLFFPLDFKFHRNLDLCTHWCIPRTLHHAWAHRITEGMDESITVLIEHDKSPVDENLWGGWGGSIAYFILISGFLNIVIKYT